MKGTLLTLLVFFSCLCCFSQQKEGRVVYERIAHLQIRINDGDNRDENLPQTRTDKFELLFGNSQSLWRASDEETPPEEGPAGGIQIRMYGGGIDDISFYDLTSGSVIEQREMFDKKYIISDSIKKLGWKLSGEAKTILNHVCQKATAQRIGTRTMMNIDNGKMERKEVGDTSNIVAWYTTDIPVAAGPGEYQNQLPGLILEIDINNGRQVFKAVEISAKTDIASIKPPKNGKKVTRNEFQKETQKMMDEMERNNHGGNRTIRINN